MKLIERIDRYLGESQQLSLLTPNLPKSKDKNGNEVYGTSTFKKQKGLKKVHYGVAEIAYNDKGFVSVAYLGGLGSRMKDVKDAVDHIFGPGAFTEIYGNKTFEAGSPDYQYEMESIIDPNKWFNKNKKVPV